MEELENIILYVVRNKEGKWFRRKGYGGSGDSWVDDFKLARIYTNTRGARAIVGYFALNYPTYGVPDIIELKVSISNVINEEERIAKQQERKKKRQETAEIRQKERNLKQAQKEYELAKQRLENLQ